MYRDIRSVQNTRYEILRILADGYVHSGAELGQCLNMTRAAIWKHVQALQEYGLQVSSSKGKGYCLPDPIELLDTHTIVNHLEKISKNKLRSLEVLFELDSTNRYFMLRQESEDIHAHALLAEYQSAGKGRRGSHWISPLAASINLSFAWHYDEPPPSLNCLPLAVGVAVVHALEQMKIPEIGLKWPNDIYWRGRKLGGILVESRTENAGQCEVVVGIGINVSLSQTVSGIDQPWVDIASIINKAPSRNELAAHLLKELQDLLMGLNEMSLTRCVEEWRNYDCAAGKQATLTTAQGRCTGQIMGVDDNGLLLMVVDGYVQRFMSGQISIRVQD